MSTVNIHRIPQPAWTYSECLGYHGVEIGPFGPLANHHWSQIMFLLLFMLLRKDRWCKFAIIFVPARSGNEAKDLPQLDPWSEPEPAHTPPPAEKVYPTWCLETCLNTKEEKKHNTYECNTLATPTGALGQSYKLQCKRCLKACFYKDNNIWVWLTLSSKSQISLENEKQETCNRVKAAPNRSLMCGCHLPGPLQSFKLRLKDLVRDMGCLSEVPKKEANPEGCEVDEVGPQPIEWTWLPIFRWSFSVFRLSTVDWNTNKFEIKAGKKSCPEVLSRSSEPPCCPWRLWVAPADEQNLKPPVGCLLALSLSPKVLSADPTLPSRHILPPLLSPWSWRECHTRQGQKKQKMKCSRQSRTDNSTLTLTRCQMSKFWGTSRGSPLHPLLRAASSVNLERRSQEWQFLQCPSRFWGLSWCWRPCWKSFSAREKEDHAETVKHTNWSMFDCMTEEFKGKTLANGIPARQLEPKNQTPSFSKTAWRSALVSSVHLKSLHDPNIQFHLPFFYDVLYSCYSVKGKSNLHSAVYLCWRPHSETHHTYEGMRGAMSGWKVHIGSLLSWWVGLAPFSRAPQ